MENNKMDDQTVETEASSVRTVVLPHRKGRNKGFLIFLSILAAIILFVIVVAAAGNSAGDDNHPYAVNEPYIATVYVEGEIGGGTTDTFGTPIGYQHQWTLDQIDYLMSDYNNEGILLYVDSPGGGVYESDELYLKIKEYQETTERPVYAYMGNYAASGGYYVLASADKIVANRNTWTGSIGVKLGSMVDISGLLDRYGIKVTEIASGSNKNMGSMLQPMTEEQKAILQSLVDEAYDTFVSVVSEGTGLPESRVRQLADGRIYTAKQALDLGLIDGIGTYEQTMEEMKEENDLMYCTEVDVEYASNSFLGSLFSRLDVLAAQLPKSDLGQLMGIVEEQKKYPISYLCDF